MPFDRFLIAPFNSGLETDLRPWQIMDDSFPVLKNSYVFRGRVRKRAGSILMTISPLGSRLRVLIGTTDSMGDFTGTVPSLSGAVGQLFSVGTDTFTVTDLGTPADLLASDITATGTFNTSTGEVILDATISLTSVFWYPALPVMGITQYEIGAVNNHPTYAFDTIYAYSFVPLNGWQRLGSAVWQGGDLNFFWSTNWQGLAGNPVLFTTNFNASIPTAMATDDPIWWYDGTIWTAASGFNAFYFLPQSLPLYSGPFIKTARLIVPFKNRLVLLNTVENNNPRPASAGTTDGSGNAAGTIAGAPFAIGNFFVIGTSIFKVTQASGALTVIGTGSGTFNISTGVYSFTGAPATSSIYFYTGATGVNTSYVNRCRYSWNGSPFDRNAWYEPNQQDSSPGVIDNNNIAAGAGFIDAPTEEQIISCEFIKDHLIVYFERSTWELAYTGNEIQPFVWNKLNTELGSQSTFSTVPFDKEVFTIGQTGFHQCNGSNVVRFDDKIPQQIFSFQTKNNANQRICGIRDYISELVYWAYVDTNAVPTIKYPNQLIVYNYKNQSWAIHDDTFTALGYFEQQADTTWATSAPQTWEQSNEAWNSGVIAANQRQILAGNMEGFVVRLSDDIARNCAALQITNVTGTTGVITLTIVAHNLDDIPTVNQFDQDFILLENMTWFDQGSYLNGNIYEVDHVVNANTITIDIGTTVIPVYRGSGTAARVSNIQITTKQFNPYDKQDRNVFIERINFCVERTLDNYDPTQPSPQITVDYSPSSSGVRMIQGGVATGAIMGNSILETGPYNPIYYPLEQYQDRLWHPIYFQSDGNCIQIYMYMTPSQMTNPRIALADFELEGMILYAQPTTSRMM